jgi:formylmethanofuran dehydrogenase subunit E-like metal-binding protein
MFQKRSNRMKYFVLLAASLMLLTAALAYPHTADAATGKCEYRFWHEVGAKAALKAVGMMHRNGIRLKSKYCIAITNAGYAEIDDRSTAGALDGLSRTLGVSRGNHSLIEIHSAPGAALYVAIYDENSGYCAYLQVDPDRVATAENLRGLDKKSFFAVTALEQIDAEHLYENAEAYAEKFDNHIFGGNEFRIVTIANAVAAGAPTCAVRSFEFHDHYCPGVTSGILMALYLKTSFPLPSGGSYFIQSVSPWCKEDALVVMLNTTPGKKAYAVTYPTAEDIAAWPEWARNASTIAYRKDPASGTWDGVVLGVEWGNTDCPVYGNSVIDKLCTDLWYLKRLDQPEEFIKVLYEFELPAGVDPYSYARPGVDPILLLDQHKLSQEQ